LHHVGVHAIITFVITHLHPEQALAAAVRSAGGVTELSRSIGVPPSLPSMWRKRGRVPAEHCPAIERATKGAVRCEDLRPDIEWGVLRQGGVTGQQQGAT
jgi:DNA-binding transcriptional regulator YdaS (Cro superfamily)